MVVYRRLREKPQFTVAALDGTTWSGRAADAAYRVDTRLKAGVRNILVDVAGTSDVSNDARTIPQVVGDLESYMAARRAAGWDVIIGCTVPPASHLLTAPMVARRTELNAAIRTTAAYDGVIDLAGHPLLNDALQWTADGIHPNWLGAEAMADLAMGVLAAHGLK
jgi:lysophospholipase L1-like esterase